MVYYNALSLVEQRYPRGTAEYAAAVAMLNDIVYGEDVTNDDELVRLVGQWVEQAANQAVVNKPIPSHVADIIIARAQSAQAT